MMLHFLKRHQNKKLTQQLAFQAVVFLSVFSLFFFSIGFSPLHAIVAALIGFFSIMLLFKLLNLPFFVLPGITGPVYVPSPPEVVKNMIKLTKVKKGEKTIDVGSGDGRIVIAMAEAGADATGVELNPSMVEHAEKQITERKLKNARILWQNFWEVDFSKYDVVTIYGFPSVMPDLEKKLRAELKPGARVASYQFDLPGWKHVKKEHDIYLYKQT